MIYVHNLHEMYELLILPNQTQHWATIGEWNPCLNSFPEKLLVESAKAPRVACLLEMKAN